MSQHTLNSFYSLRIQERILQVASTAPLRLSTSRQGRTGRGGGPAADEAVEARRQAGQSSGQRGFSKRGSLLRLTHPGEWEGRRWSQSRRPSLTNKRKRPTTSRNRNT